MTSHNLAMSTSAAYGLKDRLSGARHPANWRLSSVKSSGGAKPGTAEAMASRRLFNRGASYNNARVNSTTGFSRGPVGGAKLDDDRPDRLLKTHHPHKPGRSANVNRTLPHQRPVDLRKLNNRVSAAPASGKSSFLPNISPSACHLSFSHFSSGHQGSGAARSSFYSASMGSQAGSMLPHAQNRLRANHGPPLPLSQAHYPSVKEMGRRKQAAQIAQKEYIDLYVGDPSDEVFHDYILTQNDRLHKF